MKLCEWGWLVGWWVVGFSIPLSLSFTHFADVWFHQRKTILLVIEFRMELICGWSCNRQLPQSIIDITTSTRSFPSLICPTRSSRGQILIRGPTLGHDARHESKLCHNSSSLSNYFHTIYCIIGPRLPFFFLSHWRGNVSSSICLRLTFTLFKSWRKTQICVCKLYSHKFFTPKWIENHFFWII